MVVGCAPHWCAIGRREVTIDRLVGAVTVMPLFCGTAHTCASATALCSHKTIGSTSRAATSNPAHERS